MERGIESANNLIDAKGGGNHLFKNIWSFLRGVKFVNKTGRGGYGVVWRVNVTIKRRRRLDSGEINLRKVKLELACKIMALKETEIHRHLNHENVVKVKKLINIYDNVSGFVCDGCLDRMIWKAWTLSEDKTREWFQQISEGLRYLHSQNVIHLYIKPNNILYKKEIFRQI
jgi:serine/threonine protein kinase